MTVLAHEDDTTRSFRRGACPPTASESIRIRAGWPERVTREWAWAARPDAGVRVCVLDSGIELDHPLVGEVQRSVAVTKEGDEIVVEDDDRATSAATARPAPGSSARSRPNAS